MVCVRGVCVGRYVVGRFANRPYRFVGHSVLRGVSSPRDNGLRTYELRWGGFETRPCYVGHMVWGDVRRISSQHVPDAFRRHLQRLPVGHVCVIGPEPEAETVPVETGDHVQVNVENVLARRLPVGQKQVDPLAIEPALVERGGHSLRDTEHPGARICG